MKSIFNLFALVWIIVLPAVGAAQAPAAHARDGRVPAQASSDRSLAQATPEAASGRGNQKLTVAHRDMVVAAHPLAAAAGREVLRAGGNAVDAAIATALVLGVVEPQSSGIGGGGFLIAYDHASGRMTVWDGRETAPAAARAERFLGADGKPMRFGQAVGSGLSVGVPGEVAMLETSHRAGGRLPWPRLFDAAIRTAEQGFLISPRLATEIAEDPLLARNAAARAYFFDTDGSPKQAGERLADPQLAAVLKRIASEGSSAFYSGDIPRDIVAAVHAVTVPGDLAEDDFTRYKPEQREALCGTYRAWRICGVPPPSSGAATTLELLGLLQRFPMGRMKPESLDAVHLFAEAGRLAYADRDRYLADPAFQPQPVAQLLDPAYLKTRSALIDPRRDMGRAAPGTFPGAPVAGEDRTLALPSTTQVSVVDADGNAVSMTVSVEAAFGSRIMVDGFLLNNQLTDFSFLPSVDGLPAANRVEAGKRPRSAMAPTLVFGPIGKSGKNGGEPPLRWVLGSPGGPMIINYVSKALVGLIDWKMDVQSASALPNLGNRNTYTQLEDGTPLAKLAPALRERRHDVWLTDETSGLNMIEVQHPSARTKNGRAGTVLYGGADPRREGVALGD